MFPWHEMRMQIEPISPPRTAHAEPSRTRSATVFSNIIIKSRRREESQIAFAFNDYSNRVAFRPNIKNLHTLRARIN